MRIVLSDFMSLDGVVQAPGGADEDTDNGFRHGGWSVPFFDPDAMGPVLDDALERTDALLFGRRTWQTMAAAWPERAGDPFADRMNALAKYVVSSTLAADDLTWANTTLIPGDDAMSEITRLRATDGRDIQVMGSSQLARTLIAADVVDEYRLMVEPVTLAGGKRLFPDDGTARPLELVDTSSTSTGVVICIYRPAPP